MNSDIKTIPFKTATPKSAINPTPAEILKGISRITSANTPPIADNGIAVKMIIPSLNDLKAKYNRAKIINKAAGTATPNLALAC
ncbi:hypothetical protein D3C86_393410 [compost metagenome]